MRQRRGIYVLLAVAVLLTGARSLLALRGFFYSDDYGLRYRAATQALDLDFLTQTYNGHVNPVGWSLAWLAQRAFPGSYVAVVAVLAILWVATLLVAGWLAVELTDKLMPAILTMLILSVTPFQWDVSVWWSAAIYAIPYQLFMLLTIAALVRTRAMESPGAFRWLATAFYLLACLSFSRGVMGLLLVFVCVTCLPWGGRAPMGAKQGWSWGRDVWASMLGVAALTGAFVVVRIWASDRPSGDPGAVVRATRDMLTHNILPGLWGGPGSWFPVPLPDGWPSVIAVPAPSAVVMIAASVMTVATLIGIWMTRRQLRAFVIGTIAWVGAVAVVAAAARAGTALSSPAYRYTFDAVWPAVFLVALHTQSIRRPRVRWGLGLLGAGLVLAALASTSVPARLWGHNLGKPYVSNASAGFASIPAGQVVLPQAAPAGMVDPLLLAPYADTQAVLQPQSGSPEFGESAGEQLLGFAADGRVEIQDVEGPQSVTGPDPDCGYAVTSNPRLVPLDGELVNWNWYARAAYFTGTATTLNVAFGGRITTVPLAAGGLTSVFFPVSGPGRDVLVSVNDPGVTVCLTELRIGNRVGPGGDVVAAPPGGGRNG